MHGFLFRKMEYHDFRIGCVLADKESRELILEEDHSSTVPVHSGISYARQLSVPV